MDVDVSNADNSANVTIIQNNNKKEEEDNNNNVISEQDNTHDIDHGDGGELRLQPQTTEVLR
jgi:hypothetical protein